MASSDRAAQPDTCVQAMEVPVKERVLHVVVCGIVMEAVMDAVMDAVMKTVFSVTPDAREPFFVINIYPLGHPSPIEGGGTPQ